MFALITRPLQEALNLAKNLQKLAYEPLILPMIETFTLTEQKDTLNSALANKPQLVIITSPAGAKAFCELASSDFNMQKIIVVGQKTSSILQQANFVNVLIQNQTAVELAFWLITNLFSKDQEILYCSGNIISFAITDYLNQQGFKANRLVIYQAQETGEITSDLVDKVQKKQLKIALFLSARTSQIFAEKLFKQNIKLDFSDVTAYCFSQKIADNIKEVNWKKIIICHQPSEENLLDLVRSHG